MPACQSSDPRDLRWPLRVFFFLAVWFGPDRLEVVYSRWHRERLRSSHFGGTLSRFLLTDLQQRRRRWSSETETCVSSPSKRRLVVLALFDFPLRQEMVAPKLPVWLLLETYHLFSSLPESSWKVCYYCWLRRHGGGLQGLVCRQRAGGTSCC